MAMVTILLVTSMPRETNFKITTLVCISYTAFVIIVAVSCNLEEILITPEISPFQRRSRCLPERDLT